MQHFFVDLGNIEDKIVRITGDDVNHISNVLRMKIGEEISVSNGVDNKDYRCIIDSIGEDEVIAKIVFVQEVGLELPAKVYLFQGLPKADKMELIIQKAVELGVYEVIPVATRRAVVKLDEKKAASKVARWQSISEAAAKQSKRAIIPKVADVMTFKDAVKVAGEYESSVIPYELCEGMTKTKEWLDSLSSSAFTDSEKRIAVFIGPEGGFDEEEIAEALGTGIMPISLVKRILRTETAGMTTLSLIMYHLEISKE